MRFMAIWDQKYILNKTKGTLVHERERITLLSKGTPSLATPGHGTPALDIPNYPRTWMSSTED